MTTEPAPLGADDRAALDLEGRFWKHAGVKEDMIRSRLGVTPVRHHQRVLRLLDDPAALAYAPATVLRLRRVRDARSPGRRRSARDR